MSLSPKRSFSKKLHYNKYLYKVNLFNELGFLFRGDRNKCATEKFPFARARITEFKQSIQQGEEIVVGRFRASRVLPKSELADAETILDILCRYEDIKIRVEYFYNLWVYTNDKALVDDLLAEVPNCVSEYWDVDPQAKQFLKGNTNHVLVKTPVEYEYKIYLTNRTKHYPQIADWIRRNPDKIKVGDKTLECLDREWITNNYFYVKNEKVLLLVKMIGGDSLGRTERLIYEGDVDKYSYELKK